jgi:hypothetical protein
MIKNKNKIYKKGEFYGLYGLQSDDESSIILNGRR